MYDQTQTTFQLKHVIAVNSLANGICYNIQIRTFDKNNIASPWSKTQVFYCFSAPAFSFENIAANQIVKNSSIEARLTYTQAQSEVLNSVQFILYDAHRAELVRSGTLYNMNALKYTYSNLENNHQYFVRAIGETLNGMVVDTGFVAVSVNYITPTTYATVDLVNLYNEGQILIRSYLISILGKSNPDPVIYINGNKADLTAKDSWVKFDKGFEITGDFTLQKKIEKVVDDGIVILLSNGVDTIEVKYRKGTFASQTSEKGYFMMRVSNALSAYIQMSNYLPLPIANTDSIYIWIRRKNNVYEIRASIGGVT